MFLTYLRKGILSLLILIALLLGGEIFLLKVVGVVPSTDRMATYQFDENLGWKTRSDFKYYRSSLYYGHFNYYSPEGYPTDRAHWHSAAARNVPTIAFLGSSHAESYYLPYEQSFPYRVEQASGKQVVNLGVSGYAPDQYLLRARAELPKYPVTDIVVIFFPFNDLPNIERSDYQDVAKPVFGETFDRPINTPLTPPPPAPVGMGFVARVRSSATYTLLRPLVRRMLPVKIKVSTKQPGTYDPAQMEKVMTIFATIAKENPSARVHIFAIPFYKELEKPELYRENLAVYEKSCIGRPFSCASMDPIIATHKDPGDIFILGDGHVTAYGAKLIADEIIKMLAG